MILQAKRSPERSPRHSLFDPRVTFPVGIAVWAASLVGAIANPLTVRDDFVIGHPNPKGEAWLLLSIATGVVAIAAGAMFVLDRWRHHRIIRAPCCQHGCIGDVIRKAIRREVRSSGSHSGFLRLWACWLSA